MAKDTQKYGPKNLDIKLDGDDLVIRVDTKSMAHNPDGTPCLAGTPNKQGEARKMNLVATSSGRARIGTVEVSVNVMSIT